MAEEIGFENGRNSNFEGLVTLTLDPVIRHTVVHIYQISLKSKKLFVDGRTYIFPPSNIIRSTFGSRPKNRCLKSFNLLKIIDHKDWGADQKPLPTLQRTLIRSKIEYGSVYAST